jgi:hypothetical protein
MTPAALPGWRMQVVPAVSKYLCPLAGPAAADLAEMKRQLAAHLHRYYGRAEEVLARIEAGRQRDGDELELRDLDRPPRVQARNSRSRCVAKPTTTQVFA